jgi:hypothetical protein
MMIMVIMMMMITTSEFSFSRQTVWFSSNALYLYVGGSHLGFRFWYQLCLHTSLVFPALLSRRFLKRRLQLLSLQSSVYEVYARAALTLRNSELYRDFMCGFLVTLGINSH